MKRLFVTILIFFCCGQCSLISQTLEPSWDLSLGEQTNKTGDRPTGFVEIDDDCFLVSLLNIGNNDEEIGSGDSRIVKLNSDGELLHEITLTFDEHYDVQYMILDKWNNDTVNVFTLLADKEKGGAVVMHTYLLHDLSVSENNEIKRIEIEDLQLSCTSFKILVDKNGCRTFFIELSTHDLMETFVILFSIDDKLNVVSESCTYNQLDDLNSAILTSTGYLTYNADSTQYYYVSDTPDYPYYYFMNVFDMDFNLVEQIRFDSDPVANLQGFHGTWHQNPYDGKIYAIGIVTHPNIRSEICAFKVDIDNDDVDFLRLSYTSKDIINNIILGGNNLCFLPSGEIFGCAIYDYKSLAQYANDAYYAYISVFDSNMKKQSEWYYTKGEIYNHFFDHMYLTKDNDIILMGVVRFMIGDEIFWKPYIVKFPASAFDTDNIEEAHAYGLHLAMAYPNPGGDVLNIRTGLRNATLSVYDMQGRMVHQQEITDDVTSVDASNWQSGTYVWELGTENGNEYGNGILESGKWVK